MKVELKQPEAKFQPIKIEITIESLEELKALRARSILVMSEVKSHLSQNFLEDFETDSIETHLQDLIENLKNVTN